MSVILEKSTCMNPSYWLIAIWLLLLHRWKILLVGSHNWAHQNPVQNPKMLLVTDNNVSVEIKNFITTYSCLWPTQELRVMKKVITDGWWVMKENFYIILYATICLALWVVLTRECWILLNGKFIFQIKLHLFPINIMMNQIKAKWSLNIGFI